MNALEKKIAEGEHLHQDFKFFLSDTKKISRSLAAFANADGGHLLVGVKDNGKIVGLKNEEEETHVIEAAATIFCKPAVEYTSSIWVCGKKRILDVNVPKSEKAPHTAPDEDGKPTIYIRKADENKVATPLEAEYLRLKKTRKQIEISFTPSIQKITSYLTEHDMELSINTPFNINAISRSCMIPRKECIEIIGKLILMNEEQ